MGWYIGAHNWCYVAVSNGLRVLTQKSEPCKKSRNNSAVTDLFLNIGKPNLPPWQHSSVLLESTQEEPWVLPIYMYSVLRSNEGMKL